MNKKERNEEGSSRNRTKCQFPQELEMNIASENFVYHIENLGNAPLKKMLAEKRVENKYDTRGSF